MSMPLWVTYDAYAPACSDCIGTSINGPSSLRILQGLRRLFPTRWNELRNVGPTGSRFDHHQPDPKGRVLMGPATGRAVDQPRGSLYVASDIPTGELFIQAEGLLRRHSS